MGSFHVEPSKDAVASMINSEIGALLAVMRRNVHYIANNDQLEHSLIHSLKELRKTIFSRIHLSSDVGNVDWDQNSRENKVENGDIGIVSDTLSTDKDSPNSELVIPKTVLKNEENVAANGENAMNAPYGIPCMVEIFHFLCTLLNVGRTGDANPKSNPVAFDEDVPLFALGLINSAIELGGPSFRDHPKLLTLIQEELFYNLTQFGVSMSPLILSTVYSIVHNLYLSLRTEFKVQLEAFLSCVLLRIAHSKHGSSYQQEVAMEALVDLCRQRTFMAEMFANFDCDITCTNVFEDLSNLLSKSAFPVNGPLCAMNILALDGLISMVEGMAERVGEELLASDDSADEERYKEFWTVRCENYKDPNFWVPFVRKTKHIKKTLMLGADHFNRDPEKGLKDLQEMHLLPEELDPKSVACFLRYTCGLDKNLIGDYLGNHDQFCGQVVYEFAKTFDFQNMNLDAALSLFLGTLRLPGGAQKIHNVLEAFSERYYEQSPHTLANKDAAYVLSYNIIMLNTDHHNRHVKKKMTEQDFIRNNRNINGGADLPREYLSELYHSICDSEIQMILPDQGAGFQMMTARRWMSVINKSKETSPYILCDTASYLDRDMFYILCGPTIAATLVVFEQAHQEDVLQRCVDGLLALAKLFAYYHLNNDVDNLVESLYKFTPFFAQLSADEAVLALGEDARARMATEALFLIANKYGDNINTGWKNILECVLCLQKLLILPAHIASDATDHKQARGIVKDCHIDSIFSNSKFLQAESLQKLVNSHVKASEKD